MSLTRKKNEKGNKKNPKLNYTHESSELSIIVEWQTLTEWCGIARKIQGWNRAASIDFEIRGTEIGFALSAS